MKKIFSKTGVNGTYTGHITLSKNYASVAVNYHNPSTHDNDVTYLPISKVEIFRDEKIIETFDDIKSEKDLIEKIKKAEKILIEKLKFDANSKNINLLNNFLKESGYE